MCCSGGDADSLAVECFRLEVAKHIFLERSKLLSFTPTSAYTKAAMHTASSSLQTVLRPRERSQTACKGLRLCRASRRRTPTRTVTAPKRPCTSRTQAKHRFLHTCKPSAPPQEARLLSSTSSTRPAKRHSGCRTAVRTWRGSTATTAAVGHSPQRRRSILQR